MSPTVIYLHGFASSPHGTKGTFFREKLADYAVHFRAPDLNVPDFEHLTVTAMLDRTATEVRASAPGPVYLIGSSLGGLVALHFISQYRDGPGARVQKIFFMAPAFEKIWNDDAMMDQWQAEGQIPVHHYAYNEARPLHYQFVEDRAQYDSSAVQVDIPVLIVHGRQDEAVDYRASERFAKRHPHAALHLVDADHALADQLDTMLDLMITFFEL